MAVCTNCANVPLGFHRIIKSGQERTRTSNLRIMNLFFMLWSFIQITHFLRRTTNCTTCPEFQNKIAGRGGLAPPTTDLPVNLYCWGRLYKQRRVRRSTAELPARKTKTKNKKVGDKEGFAPSTYGTLIKYFAVVVFTNDTLRCSTAELLVQNIKLMIIRRRMFTTP